MNIFKRPSKTFALTLGTCAAVLLGATSAQAQAFTDEQKAELQQMFKEYLADNPEQILESVDNYRVEQEQKTQLSATEKLKDYKAFFANDDRPSAGNPKGDVTVVEFFDYNCGYCKKAFSDIQTIIQDDANVRVVFQEMPILSPSSKTMSELALAAQKQGKYFEMHTALMDHRGAQSDEAFLGVAEKIGLDIEKLKADAKHEDVVKEIAKSMEMASTLGIRGTPGFVIGDKIYPGYIGIDGVKNAIKEARAAAAAAK